MLASQAVRRSLESVAQDKINRTTEQLLDLPGHFKKLIGRHGCRVVQGRQQVDIAVCLLLSPRERPEDSQVPQPVPAAEGSKLGTNLVQKRRIGRCGYDFIFPRQHASRKQQERAPARSQSPPDCSRSRPASELGADGEVDVLAAVVGVGRRGAVDEGRLPALADAHRHTRAAVEVVARGAQVLEGPRSCSPFRIRKPCRACGGAGGERRSRRQPRPATRRSRARGRLCRRRRGCRRPAAHRRCSRDRAGC